MRSADIWVFVHYRFFSLQATNSVRPRRYAWVRIGAQAQPASGRITFPGAIHPNCSRPLRSGCTLFRPDPHPNRRALCVGVALVRTYTLGVPRSADLVTKLTPEPGLTSEVQCKCCSIAALMFLSNDAGLMSNSLFRSLFSGLLLISLLACTTSPVKERSSDGVVEARNQFRHSNPPHKVHLVPLYLNF